MDDMQVAAQIGALGCAVVLIACMDKVEGLLAKTALWIGSIILLCIAAGLGKAFLFIVLESFEGVNHMPLWLVRTFIGLGIGYFLRYILLLVTKMIFNLGVEIDKANARLHLMENLLRDKLDEIAERLPKPDEPDDFLMD